MSDQQHVKVTGESHIISPPEGHEMPYCRACFTSPDEIGLITPDIASRMRAKLARVSIPRMLIELRPCRHVVRIEKGDNLEEKIEAVLGRKLS